MAAYSLRKRGKEESGSSASPRWLESLGGSSSKVIVFSGSGVSASAGPGRLPSLSRSRLSSSSTEGPSLVTVFLPGMSMFSTKGGLYARAKKRLKLPDGVKLFSYKYYKDNKPQAEAFYVGIYNEALQASPTAAHKAIHQLSQQGRLQRHYTLNIDGLAQQTGMDVWDLEANPSGSIVELHGNIRFLVCPKCRAVQRVNTNAVKHLQQQRSVLCVDCEEEHVRFKVMLYDDAEGEAITPASVFGLLQADLAAADAVVWAGISFEQSASTGYFQRVWDMLVAQGRTAAVKQVLVNPDEDAMFNLVSSCSSIDVEANVILAMGTADDALPLLAQRPQG